MSNPNGGPAFPMPHFRLVNGETEWGDSGMTMRDWLAGKAMQGDWAAQNEISGTFPDDHTQEELEKRAKLYYRMADAMLAVREESM